MRLAALLPERRRSGHHYRWRPRWSSRPPAGTIRLAVGQRIVDGRKQIGFINDRGEITIAPRYYEAESFCGGKAAVVEGGRRFYVDKRGNETTPPVPSGS